jgi:hypothetical protein
MKVVLIVIIRLKIVHLVKRDFIWMVIIARVNVEMDFMLI